MSETLKNNAADAGSAADSRPVAGTGPAAGREPASGLCPEHAWREGIRPGGVVSRMLDAAAPVWEACHVHPFVRGIADGSLDRGRFCFYMLQDYVYLFEYARVFAIGVAKAKDPEVMRVYAGYVRQILDGEMDIHRGYMKRLGISPGEAERTVPSLDTLSYTSYMIRIAYDDGAAEVAAAILSCALSYEAIAERMAAEHPGAADHPFYGEWVQGYACPEYHAANRELIALTEKLAEGLNEEQVRHLIEVFVNCSRYELLFWDMAWEMKS